MNEQGSKVTARPILVLTGFYNNCDYYIKIIPIDFLLHAVPLFNVVQKRAERNRAEPTISSPLPKYHLIQTAH